MRLIGVALGIGLAIGIACGCAARAPERARRDAELREAFRPTGTVPPQGELRPEKYTPPVAPARPAAPRAVAPAPAPVSASRETAPDTASAPPARQPGGHPGGDSAGAGEYLHVEVLPEAIERVPPRYPEAARESGVWGTVMVQALVGTDGLVRDARVVRSIRELDAAALECVRKWRFRPAVGDDGRPVVVWVGIPVKFTRP